jgi:hypothetical protein
VFQATHYFYMTQRLSRLIICILSLAIFCVSCKPKPAQQAKTDADLTADKEDVAGLAKRHAILLGWQTNLQKRGASAPFTYDVSRALVPTNGSPVLLLMNLDDVHESEGFLHATFSSHYMSSGFFQLVLKLECSAAQGAELLADDRSSWHRIYAIVAKLSAVTRPAFTLEGAISGEDASIEVKSESDVFVAKGRCMDLVKLRGSHFLGD